MFLIMKWRVRLALVSLTFMRSFHDRFDDIRSPRSFTVFLIGIGKPDMRILPQPLETARSCILPGWSVRPFRKDHETSSSISVWRSWIDDEDVSLQPSAIKKQMEEEVASGRSSMKIRNRRGPTHCLGVHRMWFREIRKGRNQRAHAESDRGDKKKAGQ